MSGAAEATFRYCAEFGKGGAARFLSHLDLQSAVERSLRRARLPLAYSQGFQPRPKLQFEEALPLGWSSERERLWFELAAPYPSHEAAKRLARTLPEGLRLYRVYPSPGKPRPAARRCYRVRGLEPAPDWSQRLAEAFPGPAADAPPAAALEGGVGAELVFRLRPGRKGGAPSLKKVLKTLLGENPPPGLEVLRLASEGER